MAELERGHVPPHPPPPPPGDPPPPPPSPPSEPAPEGTPLLPDMQQPPAPAPAAAATAAHPGSPPPGASSPADSAPPVRSGDTAPDSERAGHQPPKASQRQTQPQQPPSEPQLPAAGQQEKRASLTPANQRRVSLTAENLQPQVPGAIGEKERRGSPPEVIEVTIEGDEADFMRKESRPFADAAQQQQKYATGAGRPSLDRVRRGSAVKAAAAAGIPASAKAKLRMMYDANRVRAKVLAMDQDSLERARTRAREEREKRPHRAALFGSPSEGEFRRDSVQAALQDWDLFRRRRKLASYLCLFAVLHMLCILIETIAVIGPGDTPFVYDDGENCTSSCGTAADKKAGYHIICIIMSVLAVLQGLVHTRWWTLRLKELATFDHLWLGVSMWNSPLRNVWLLELASLIYHEPPGLVLVWSTSYKMNILSLLRFYIVARWLRTHSMTATQAGRIVLQISKVPNTLWFAFKVWNHTVPGLLVGVLTVLGLFLLSCAMYMAEGPDISFRQSLWLIFITGTTVGYGDISPSTDIGKIVSCVTAVFGTVMNALVVNVIMNTITLNDQQQKAVDFMRESRQHRALESYAAQIVILAWRTRAERARQPKHANVRLRWLCYRFRQVRQNFVRVQGEVHSGAQLGVMVNKLQGIEMMLAKLFHEKFPASTDPSAFPALSEHILLRMVRGSPVVSSPKHVAATVLRSPSAGSALGGVALAAADSSRMSQGAPGLIDTVRGLPQALESIRADLRTLAEVQRRQQESLAALSVAPAAVAGALVEQLRAELDASVQAAVAAALARSGLLPQQQEQLQADG